MTIAAALALSSPSYAFAQERGDDTSAEQTQSPFVGRYDGSRMETAMGMEVRENGTFSWGLSVGSFDMRAQGNWFEEDNTIIFVSEPKPVAAEFRWAGIKSAGTGAPLVRVVWASNGEPFTRARVRITCANGASATGADQGEGWSPGSDCDRAKTLQLGLPSYAIFSEAFELTGERSIQDGQSILIEFHRNDLGVANFDGMMGQFQDGELRLEGDFGPMTLRKVAPK